MTTPGIVGVLLVAVVAVGCRTDQTSDMAGDEAPTSVLESNVATTEVDLAPGTLDCFSVIDVLDTPPPGYTIVLGVVAFDGSDNATSALQATEDDRSGWFGAPTPSACSYWVLGHALGAVDHAGSDADGMGSQRIDLGAANPWV